MQPRNPPSTEIDPKHEPLGQPPPTRDAVLAALRFQLLLTHAFIARLAMRLGLKVLRYPLVEGERCGQHVGPCWLLTVNLPDGAGQLAFAFPMGDEGLLAGMPRSGPNPVQLKDLSSEDFERLVRASLACSPGAVPLAELNPWTGVDGSQASHERLLGAL